MNAEDEIVQLIEGVAGKYSPYVIFADWVKMYAIAIQNACSMQDKAWQARESQYMDVSRKYDHKEMSTFCQMNALLVDAFERGISDYLGKIYMGLGAGNKRTGQFFTPFHVSLMTARIGMADIDKEWIEENGIKLNEPISASSIESRISNLGRRVGVKAYPHKFRRTCATFALRRGMSIEQVSQMLGHESIETTQIYLDISEQDLKEAHRKFVM